MPSRPPTSPCAPWPSCSPTSRTSIPPDDRVGEITAYDLAQEHFRILSEVVAKQEGAIVKTTGDAVTATGAWGSAA